MYSGQTRPTVEYDRKIRYLDYMENGQRSRGAGFVKMERRDDRCNISLQISGLYRKDHFTRPLLLKSDGGESELCKLQLADGGLKIYLEGLNSRDLDGRGTDYNRLTGLRIPISEGKEVLCVWENPAVSERREQAFGQAREQEPAQGQAREMPREILQESIQETDGGMPREILQESVHGDTATLPRGDMPIREDNPPWGDTPVKEDNPPRADMPANMDEPASGGAQTALREDKWEQLCAIYPHIQPFSDEREYLSVGPQDFVVLPARYYPLVNNSFLLHGYYNYRHLILTRVRVRDKARYYIGVPGNLYPKEKKIAVMFGFEGFECASEPASDGDFGYYLIPVEL
ncbi:MAG: DUF6128 domain-containing protein [Acetatifactor muris]|nr:DUF6128 domain-containing protein [Acetatifactor muris]MCM1526624.1 DUF6128 domain-containing protein [Bacteroides sp.]